MSDLITEDTSELAKLRHHFMVMFGTEILEFRDYDGNDIAKFVQRMVLEARIEEMKWCIGDGRRRGTVFHDRIAELTAELARLER